MISQASDPATVVEARRVLKDDGRVITDDPISGSKGT
jgi:hypothetical protein